MATTGNWTARARSARRRHPGSTADSASEHRQTSNVADLSTTGLFVGDPPIGPATPPVPQWIPMSAAQVRGNALATVHLTGDALTPIADMRRNPPTSTG
jgi:hypothetical protein